MYEIIGYDVVNGTRTRPKKFKSRYVDTMEDLKAEREKIRKRKEREYGEPCQVYLRYRDLTINFLQE